MRRVRLTLWRLQRFDARFVSVGSVLGIDWFKLGQVVGPQTRLVRSSSFTRTFTVPFFRYKESTWRLGCLVSASHFRRGTNDSLGKAACKWLKHGCDLIQVKTSLGDIESILESILFARFENYGCQALRSIRHTKERCWRLRVHGTESVNAKRNS